MNVDANGFPEPPERSPASAAAAHDDVVSASNIELVHADGTVTDLRDGVRRPYDEHVANTLAGGLAIRDVPAPSSPASSSRWWRVAGAGAAGGAAAVLVAELVRWVR